MAVGKRERHNRRRREKRNPEKKKEYIPPTQISYTPSQSYTFNMCLRSEGRVRKTKGKYPFAYPEGTVFVDEYQVHKYRAEIPERYEFDGNKIIRTVSAFHYISKHTTINGLCRSFNFLNNRYEPTGKEKVYGAKEEVIKEFEKRYFVGTFKNFDSIGSDLDRIIRWVKVIINERYYFIVQMKNLFDDGYSFSQLYLGLEDRVALNSTVPLKLSQEEIINKIEKGEITEITHYGDPKIKYTPQEVLEKIRQD